MHHIAFSSIAFAYLPHPYLLLFLCIKFNLIFFITYLFPFYLQELFNLHSKPSLFCMGMMVAPPPERGGRSCEMPFGRTGLEPPRCQHFPCLLGVSFCCVMLSQPDRQSSRAGTSAPHLHPGLRLGPHLTVQRSPSHPHVPKHHLLILVSSEDTSLTQHLHEAPAPAHSSFFKPEYVLGWGQI